MKMVSEEGWFSIVSIYLFLGQENIGSFINETFNILLYHMNWLNRQTLKQNAVDCRYAAPVKVDIEYTRGNPIQTEIKVVKEFYHL